MSAAADSPVVYEVRLEVDRAVIAQFDEWLEGHVDEMLRVDGFESARILREQATRPGTALRVTHYRVASRRQLDAYFEEHAAHMRAEGIRLFGERMRAARAIYEDGAAVTASRGTGEACLNCGAALSGQYCAACGQRHFSRVISLWKLVSELVGDLFEVDSRLWRSLFPLLLKPGFLTREYLRGRRVHYTPPLRMYLAASVVFFLVVFFGSNGSGLVFDGAGEQSVVAPLELGDSDSAAAADQLPAPDEASAASATSREDALEKCADIEISGLLIGWIEPRARSVCRRIVAEGGAQRFVDRLIDNIPAMMFVFLPVIAALMMVLYPLSRRYYVEHLLFFVHFHSFFFVIMLLAVLLNRAPALFPGQDLLTTLTTMAIAIWIPVYLYRAMRQVYGQGRAVTGLKFVALGFAYFNALILSLIGTLAITALSV